MANIKANSLKRSFKQRFRKLYPNCKLYAISHYTYQGRLIATVFYKTKSGERHIDTYTNFDDGIVVNYADEGGNIESENTKCVKELFKDTVSLEKQTNWFNYTKEDWTNGKK